MAFALYTGFVNIIIHVIKTYPRGGPPTQKLSISTPATISRNRQVSFAQPPPQSSPSKVMTSVVFSGDIQVLLTTFVQLKSMKTIHKNVSLPLQYLGGGYQWVGRLFFVTQ